MKLFAKRILKILFFIILFVGYSYALFVHMIDVTAIHTCHDAVREIVIAIVVATTNSGLICGLLWSRISIEK